MTSAKTAAPEASTAETAAPASWTRAIAPCAGPAVAPRQRTSAERFMRRLLFISDPKDVTEQQVSRLFETSILISAIRCTLAYIVFPIFAPALYAASSWGPAIGVVIGVVALVFDVLGIRRFWVADHRWRWYMTAIYACVIPLVTTLLVTDIILLV